MGKKSYGFIGSISIFMVLTRKLDMVISKRPLLVIWATKEKNYSIHVKLLYTNKNVMI